MRGFVGGAAAFHPEVDAVHVVVGDPARPFTLTVPAGDAGWKIKKGRAEWRSRIGKQRIKLRIDMRKGAFRLSVKGIDLDPAPQGDVLFGISLGTGGGFAQSAWAGNAKGRRSLR